MSYPGGKAGAGVFQTIINLMPPHRVYIEPFLGGGAIMLNKRPAEVNVGIDLDQAAIDKFSLELKQSGLTIPAELTCGDGVGFLRRSSLTRDTLIYLDPPYLMETRSSKRSIYLHHLNQDDFTPRQHEQLLDLVKTLPCMAMISGYQSGMYAEALKEWRTVTFQAMTRRGPRMEVVWLNFPEPLELHDYRWLGSDCTDRQRIKRKKDRWKNKLINMPALERHAVLSAIEELRSSP